MSEKNKQQPKDIKQQQARTYARNRTRLSRRGFDKQPESDSVFLLKLLAAALAASFWLKFSLPIEVIGLLFGGLPIGAIVAILIIYWREKRRDSRHILYAVVLIVAILSYFLPAGIVI